MIFVALGTQIMDFSRFLRMLDEMIEHYYITEEVIVQSGKTEYESNNFTIIPFLKEEEFKQYVKEASVVISHAGSGALFNAIKAGKKIIAVARLKQYHEMVDDHQTELTRKLSQEGYLIDGTYSLVDAWAKLDGFEPRANDFKCSMVEELRVIIENYLKE